MKKKTDRTAKTASEYLKSLSPERKKILSAVRSTIKKNLPKGYTESMNWGMISYEVPLSTYPETYNGQPLMLAAIADQKNHVGIYLMCAYADKTTDKLLRDGYKKRGLRLDMGKSCIRAKSLEEIPLDVIGDVIGQFPVKKLIKYYESSRK